LEYLLRGYVYPPKTCLPRRHKQTPRLTQQFLPIQQAPLTGSKLEEIIDRMIKREHDEIAAFDLYSPIIETYIQEIKFSQAMGTVPKSDIYFLGQADFKGRLRVHSLTANNKSGSLLWSFNPAGFLQMIYIDRGAFDLSYYQFNYRRR
jgi:hypothetical protein